jgi:hypothetical protein
VQRTTTLSPSATKLCRLAAEVLARELPPHLADRLLAVVGSGQRVIRHQRARRSAPPHAFVRQARRRASQVTVLPRAYSVKAITPRRARPLPVLGAKHSPARLQKDPLCSRGATLASVERVPPLRAKAGLVAEAHPSVRAVVATLADWSVVDAIQ